MSFWKQEPPKPTEAFRNFAPMRESFRQGQFEAGLLAAVTAIDGQLRQHFAVTGGQANPDELPNRPVVR